MTMQARELEQFLRGISGQEGNADQARDLADKLEAAGILRVTPKVEIPQGVRQETIKVGTLTKSGIKAEFDAMSVIVTSDSQGLIDKITLSTGEKPVNLIFPTGRDLRLTARAPYRDFLRAGQAKGYELCKPEDGLYLRIHDSKQPVNDVYWMAMEPMTDRDGYPRVFVLGHDSSRVWLYAPWARPGALWLPDSRLAFRLPASEPQKT